MTDHCLRSRDYVNVTVAGKQAQVRWLVMDSAIKHCSAGSDIWEWASNDQEGDPDVVMACAGDVPTLETLAAVEVLRLTFPDLRVRVINVVDRFHLVADVIDRVPGLGSRAAYASQFVRDKLLEHREYVRKHGEDLPEVRG